MSSVYDDEEFESDDDGDTSENSRALIAATQEAGQALEDAAMAAQKAARYLPWLVRAGAATTAAAAAALAYGVAAYLLHSPQAAP